MRLSFSCRDTNRRRWSDCRANCRTIRWASASALIGQRVGGSDGRFQTRATRCQRVELRLHALLFDLQLTTALFTQVLRMSAADSRQAALNVLGLDLLFNLFKTRLQFGLL